MQWNKETDSMVNGWFGAQQKVWENWWDVMAGSNQNGDGTGGSDSFDAYRSSDNAPHTMLYTMWRAAMKQWQHQMEQSLQVLPPEMSENARMAMEQFIAGQGHAQQLMKMTTDAWQAIMTSAASPDEWQQALTSYIAQFRNQMADAGDATKLMENSTKLWQLYGQEMQKFSRPWMDLWMQFPQQMGMMAGSPDKANPMLNLMNLVWDSYNQTMGHLTNMPSIGLTRELNEKINRGFVTWQENQRISIEYQVILGDVMLSAFEAFMHKLLEKAQAGEVIDNQNGLLTLWVEVADKEFLELFHSERYALIQSQYVNSSMALRQQQRELTEIMLRMHDLPTRSDLDEAHKNIFQLRKEVKELKKIVHNLTTQAAAEPSASIRSSTAQSSSIKSNPKPATKSTPKPTGKKGGTSGRQPKAAGKGKEASS